MSIEAIQTGERPQIIDVKLQEASADIWDKKYRLKNKQGDPVDETIDATYRRVAKALSDVEDKGKREVWYERFLWALRNGAIPAGRIISNAGALEHKPATSTRLLYQSPTPRDPTTPRIPASA